MAAEAELSFVHLFEPGAGAVPPLLLLHGTGGDERDLAPLGRVIAPGAALLSPRGKVMENGMPRFFRRLREGVFDEADVRFRAAELAAFVGEARAAYRLPKPVAVGFSNGANIAAAVLLLSPPTLAGAVLLRPMTPLSAEDGESLTGVRALLVSGLSDPIAPLADAARLADMLRRRGAEVRQEAIVGSHGLTQRDIALSAEFVASFREG